MKLSPKEIRQHLKELESDWSLTSEGALKRTFPFDDFASAASFTMKIAEVAEEQNHHPLIKLEWGKVSVELSTHEVNGLSEKDFKLASAIEAIDVA